MANLHLGFRLDAKTGKPGVDRLVVGSGDRTTHGVILGMTGSGKTGLGVVLIEEALLAGAPASCSTRRARWRTSRSASRSSTRRASGSG
jgi:hypothetical protein